MSEDRPKKPFNKERRPYDVDRKPFDRERRPYAGEKKPFDRERRPYDGERKPFDRERRPYDGEKKPFDRERRPYGGDRKPRGPRRETTDARKLALSALCDVTIGGAYSGIALNERLRNAELSLEDKRLATSMFYTALENRMRI